MSLPSYSLVHAGCSCNACPAISTHTKLYQRATCLMWCASCQAPGQSQGGPSLAQGHLPGTAATPAAGLRSASPVAELLLLLLLLLKEHQMKGPASLRPSMLLSYDHVRLQFIAVCEFQRLAGHSRLLLVRGRRCSFLELMQ